MALLPLNTNTLLRHAIKGLTTVNVADSVAARRASDLFEFRGRDAIEVLAAPLASVFVLFTSKASKLSTLKDWGDVRQKDGRVS